MSHISQVTQPQAPSLPPPQVIQQLAPLVKLVTTAFQTVNKKLPEINAVTIATNNIGSINNPNGTEFPHRYSGCQNTTWGDLGKAASYVLESEVKRTELLSQGSDLCSLLTFLDILEKSKNPSDQRLYQEVRRYANGAGLAKTVGNWHASVHYAAQARLALHQASPAIQEEMKRAVNKQVLKSLEETLLRMFPEECLEVYQLSALLQPAMKRGVFLSCALPSAGEYANGRLMGLYAKLMPCDQAILATSAQMIASKTPFSDPLAMQLSFLRSLDASVGKACAAGWEKRKGNLPDIGEKEEWQLLPGDPIAYLTPYEMMTLAKRSPIGATLLQLLNEFKNQYCCHDQGPLFNALKRAKAEMDGAALGQCQRLYRQVLTGQGCDVFVTQEDANVKACLEKLAQTLNWSLCSANVEKGMSSLCNPARLHFVGSTSLTARLQLTAYLANIIGTTSLVAVVNCHSSSTQQGDDSALKQTQLVAQVGRYLHTQFSTTPHLPIFMVQVGDFNARTDQEIDANKTPRKAILDVVAQTLPNPKAQIAMSPERLTSHKKRGLHTNVQHDKTQSVQTSGDLGVAYWIGSSGLERKISKLDGQIGLAPYTTVFNMETFPNLSGPNGSKIPNGSCQLDHAMAVMTFKFGVFPLYDQKKS